MRKKLLTPPSRDNVQPKHIYELCYRFITQIVLAFGCFTYLWKLLKPFINIKDFLEQFPIFERYSSDPVTQSFDLQFQQAPHTRVAHTFQKRLPQPHPTLTVVPGHHKKMPYIRTSLGVEWFIVKTSLRLAERYIGRGRSCLFPFLTGTTLPRWTKWRPTRPVSFLVRGSQLSRAVTSSYSMVADREFSTSPDVENSWYACLPLVICLVWSS